MPTVHLVPNVGDNQEIQFGYGIGILLKRSLFGRVVHSGEIVMSKKIALFGKPIPFLVQSVMPDTFTQIDNDTVIIVHESSSAEAATHSTLEEEQGSVEEKQSQ